MFQPHQNGPLSRPVPPTELDVMLADISNQMAHAQMLRRLSGNSGTNSMSSRRTSAKILKSNSVGNSPHNCNIQRRKTTTSHPTRPNHSDTQDRYQARGLKVGNSYTPWRQVAQDRPMSWHPGSRNMEMAARNVPTSEPTMRNTIAGLETLVVAEEPVPSIHPFMGDDMAIPTSQPFHKSSMTLQPQCYVEGTPTMFEQPLANFDNYQQVVAGNDTIFSSCPSYGTPDLAQTQTPPVSYGYGYDQYAPLGLRTSDWAYFSSNLDDYPVPQTPDFLPIQYPADDLEISNLPRITKQKSKELVGMGLYDNIESHDHAPNHLSSLNGESMGKGLKLEETWQPPKDYEGDDEDDEEASSADEAEEEVPLSFAQAETQPAFYSAHGDLSNQTFFFDNDDQYTNCIAFDPTMQICQPKAPDQVIENSLWF